jgi:carboxylesterase type B
VNINYHLGIFGFAASSDIIQGQPVTGIRGCNFGIRDQKVGIKWVSQNIGAFGGDSTKITLGRQSAGGSSVHAHLLEAKLKAEEPLFRHACIQSGAVGTLGLLTMTRADARWETLCQYLGIEKTQEKSRVKFLQSLTTKALMQAAHDLEWKTYALVWDNSTMRITGDLGDHGIPFDFDFGEVGSDDEETRSSCNGIRILIGHTDVDVRTSSFITIRNQTAGKSNIIPSIHLTSHTGKCFQQ